MKLEIMRCRICIVKEEFYYRCGSGHSFVLRLAGPAQGPTVDIPPPATVSSLFCAIECCSHKILCTAPHRKRDSACISHQHDWKLAENRRYRQHIEDLLTDATPIYDGGSAVVEPYWN